MKPERRQVIEANQREVRAEGFGTGQKVNESIFAQLAPRDIDYNCRMAETENIYQSPESATDLAQEPKWRPGYPVYFLAVLLILICAFTILEYIGAWLTERNRTREPQNVPVNRPL